MRIVERIVGLDIGASAVKGVVLRPDGSIERRSLRPIRGDTKVTVRQALDDLLAPSANGPAHLVGLTGSGAAAFAGLLDVPAIGEIAATARGARALAPGAGALLEIGGEHSKFVRFGARERGGVRPMRDFVANSACSAGTGAFLEQEAHRLRLSLDDFARRAAEAPTCARVAGRCAVFAKTDIVHQHQNGVPVGEIAYGLCVAMAQCVAGELIGVRPFDRPLAFVGGVAGNEGMIRALRHVLRLDSDHLVVPDGHEFVGAVGAALGGAALESGRSESPAESRGAPPTLHDALGRLDRPVLDDGVAVSRTAPTTLPPLEVAFSPSPAAEELGRWPLRDERPDSPRSVGIDIGSTSTNLAYVAGEGAVLEALSVPTRGRPLEAVREVLRELARRRGVLRADSVGVTGSGRRLVAEILGADFSVNEITAHAAGCTPFFPDADTIFDIGGQDSKYIRLRDGVVVGFEMNKVCAAGTGSFLEEMAEQLGLDIVGEFEKEAALSRAPVDLGERCTVFLSSEIARRLRDGALRSDLAAGLAYSVVKNYMARVVGRHPIGSRIVFQGGVAANAAVVAALAQILGRPVSVHPRNDTAGAIGAAHLAARAGRGEAVSLEQLERRLDSVAVRSFECARCANRCAIHMTVGSGGRRFFSGGLCEEYEGRAPDAHVAPAGRGLDLLAERERALTGGVRATGRADRLPIGIPRALVFHETLPYWGAFFARLGIGVVLSEPTTKATIDRGASLTRRGACLPIKIAYGHVAELLEHGVERIFVPSIASLCDRTVPERLDHLCPVEQAWPYTTRALFHEEDRILAPRLRFSIPHLLRRDLLEFGRSLGASRGETLAAIAAAEAAQHGYHDAMLRRGDEVLASLPDGRIPLAVITRSYASGDAHVALRLKSVLDDVGFLPIPMEMLRDEPADSRSLQGMYWYFGKRALQQARARRASRDLPVLFLSSFGCGPDSFVIHMLRRELGDVPTLELELDEHNEVNGMHTRCEAFRFSLEGRRGAAPPSPAPPEGLSRRTLEGRRLHIPQMSDHAYAFAAAFRSCGVDADVLPMPDADSIARGRLALGGGECLPCACVVGDMLRCVERPPNGDPPPAFFMVSGDGPCRLGQYPWVQRAILDERGHADVPIFNASQDPDFYRRFKQIAGPFQLTAWRGTVAMDVLYRKWRETRARAARRDDADDVHRGARRSLERCIEARGDLGAELGRAFDLLDALPHRPRPPAPAIAVLGENYVRCNAAANDFLADRLEELGADVIFPALTEWVEYTNWTARLHCAYERKLVGGLRLAGIGALQHAEARRLEAPLSRRLAHAGRPSLRRLFAHASRYVPDTFEGETIVGIGRTIDLHDRGVGGVIHVAPFGCMVGGIVEILGEKISDDLGGFPILSIQYDGRNHEATASMLEGFVERAAAWESHAGGRRGDPEPSLAAARHGPSVGEAFA